MEELGFDVERHSRLVYPDISDEVREDLALEHFVQAARDLEGQQALRLAEIMDVRSALMYALKYEATQQASEKTAIL